MSGAGVEAIRALTPGEERFNRRRRTAGLLLGPLAFVLLLAAPLATPSPDAYRVSAILALVVIFWVTEALPMPATALLGPLLAIILGVAPARAAFAPFADPIIFVFMGSFILAEAMFIHGVDRRIAFTALSSRFVGRSAGRILIVYGLTAAGLSMWISNTAATAMLFPIGLSIVAHMARSGREAGRLRRFALGLMLMASFGASVGGLATPIGTPPNLIGIGMLGRLAGLEISFFHWMLLGLPLVVLIFAFLAVYFYRTCARGVELAGGGHTFARRELEKLGGIGTAERNVLIAFGVTVLLWTAPGLLTVTGLGGREVAGAFSRSMPEAAAAVTGALLLFMLPVDWKARRFTITWEQAVRIDWGIILLFGGGLSLGQMAFESGLAEAIGLGLTAWLPSHTTVALTALFTGFAIVLSEAASNTASATMIVPVAIAASEAAGIRVIEPALGATLGASMGFMMPISTPPNAIVYSSGYVPITSMMKYGVALDVAAFFIIVAGVLTLGPMLF